MEMGLTCAIITLYKADEMKGGCFIGGILDLRRASVPILEPIFGFFCCCDVVFV